MKFQFAVVAALVGSGCAPAAKNLVRVALATPAEFEAAREKETTWYEFREGDLVPFRFAIFGAPDGASPQPALVKARRSFYLVARRDLPMAVSFDGETFAGPMSMQSVVAVGPRVGESGGDASGGEVTWLIYVGASDDPRAALHELLAPVEQAPESKRPAASPGDRRQPFGAEPE